MSIVPWLHLGRHERLKGILSYVVVQASTAPGPSGSNGLPAAAPVEEVSLSDAGRRGLVGVLQVAVSVNRISQ